MPASGMTVLECSTGRTAESEPGALPRQEDEGAGVAAAAAADDDNDPPPPDPEGGAEEERAFLSKELDGAQSEARPARSASEDVGVPHNAREREVSEEDCFCDEGGGPSPRLWEAVASVQRHRDLDALSQKLQDLRDSADCARATWRGIVRALDWTAAEDRMFRKEHPDFSGSDVGEAQGPLRLQAASWAGWLCRARSGDNELLDVLRGLESDSEYGLLRCATQEELAGLEKESLRKLRDALRTVSRTKRLLTEGQNFYSVVIPRLELLGQEVKDLNGRLRGKMELHLCQREEDTGETLESPPIRLSDRGADDLFAAGAAGLVPHFDNPYAVDLEAISALDESDAIVSVQPPAPPMRLSDRVVNDLFATGAAGLAPRGDKPYAVDLEAIGALDESDAIVSVALRNYEEFHGLDPGSVTDAAVLEASSAGILGWASAFDVPTHTPSPDGCRRHEGSTDEADGDGSPKPSAHAAARSDEEEARQLRAALLQSVGANPCGAAKPDAEDKCPAAFATAYEYSEEEDGGDWSEEKEEEQIYEYSEEEEEEEVS